MQVRRRRVIAGGGDHLLRSLGARLRVGGDPPSLLDDLARRGDQLCGFFDFDESTAVHVASMPSARDAPTALMRPLSDSNFRKVPLAYHPLRRRGA